MLLLTLEEIAFGDLFLEVASEDVLETAGAGHLLRCDKG